MTRQLLIILVAATQIAALPLTVNPPTAEVGTPLSISITLPDETTELVGLPDLSSFVLLGSPERSDNILTLHLLPLRAGNHSIPPLPFRTAQRHDTTAETPLSITAPPVPDAPHPLRPFPEPDLQNGSAGPWIPMATGGVILTIFLLFTIRRQVSKIVKQSCTTVDRFSELATAAEKIRITNDPDWDRFCQRLDRVRFSPIQYSPNDLQALTDEFTRLRGETP